MYKKRIMVSLTVILLMSSFCVNHTVANDENSTTDESIRNDINNINLPKVQQVFDKRADHVMSSSLETDTDVPEINLLKANSIVVGNTENSENFENVQFEDKVNNEIYKTSSIKFSVNDTPDVIQIYYKRTTDGSITTYGLAGETLDIHFIIKGLITTGSRLLFTFRKDIVNWPDSDLSTGYYDLSADLLGSEELHLVWSITLDADQNDFGLGFMDIRSYFLKVEVEAGNMLFDGSGTDSYRLWMCGFLKLYGVQYYNYTTDSRWVPVSYAVPGWKIFVTYYIAVVNAPIWDFNIQGVIKADVVWGIDETLYSDDEKTISSVIAPGIYYYNWSNTEGVPYYFTVPIRSYGNSPGDTRGLFGTLYMNGDQVDALDPDYARDDLNILSNTTPQPPLVTIELPLDGYVTYNDTLSLSVDITDPNSNYDITIVEVLLEGSWLDVIAYYNANTGRLDIYVTNAFTLNGIKNITVRAEDSDGNLGFDSTIIQFYDYGYFFPNDYIVENSRRSLNLFNEEFRYEHKFTWEDEDTNISIIPYFSVTVDTSVDYELLLAYPSATKSGEEFTTYLKVVNPEIVLTITLDLGIDYEFQSGENYYSGSSSLYNKEISKGLALNFGIFRIDLREISPLIKSISHSEIETKDFLPGYIDWLVNFKLEVDFIPILKLKNLLEFDLSGINCNTMFNSMAITSDSLYAIPCTVSSTANGDDEAMITLDNFEVNTAAGFEAYCQVTFSGKILGFPIGPIDVNEWLYEHFGILIPHLDLWLIGVTIPFSGSLTIVVPLDPVDMELKIIDMFYALDNITYRFEIKDANGNLVTGAAVSVDDHSKTYSGIEETTGVYTVVMDYYGLPEIIYVTVTKAGYAGISTSFDLFVDPPAVTKGVILEYTLISAGALALVASVTSMIVLRYRRRS